MKKFALLIVSVMVLFFSCTSVPVSNKTSADDVLTKFASGLENKDIGLLMEAYWPEAVFTFIPPEGAKMILNGIDEIRDGQLGGMKNTTPFKVRIDTAKKEELGSSITYTVLVEYPDNALTNILELEKRGNEWKIIRQVVKF